VLLAKDTAAAVSGGCSNLLSAGLGRILADIKQSMSEDMLIVLTGGSADELQRSLSASHELIVEPDLVMHGLRIVSEQL
jgi:pantothenate kinase type III